jgi:hypothetical protein
MKAIHRMACAALMLGIMIGCAGEENAAPPAGGPTGPMGGGRPPGPPPGVPSEPGKAAPSKEMTPPPPDTKKPGAEGPKMEGPKTSNAEAPAAKLSDEELAGIKELPTGEQDAAIKQISCPVSGHHLGEMGKPIRVMAEGRTFYLCCEDCEGKVKSDPKAVIAKLDAKK